MAGDLLVPDCLPEIANPLSGVYIPVFHRNDTNLTLVALRLNKDSGAIEGRIDGVFPYFVHAKFPARIGGAIPPVGDTPAYMLKTAVEKSSMYGRRWALDDGYQQGSYIVMMEPALDRLFIDPLQKVSKTQEWDFGLPNRLGAAWLYIMTDTPDGKTISRRNTTGGFDERYLLPDEDNKFVAAIDSAINH